MRWLVWWCMAGIGACGGSSSVSGKGGGASGASGDGGAGAGGEAPGASGGSGTAAVAGAGASSTAGQGTAGQGTAGQGTAGQGTAGQGTAGQGTAGQGTAGQGGQGTAGQGGESGGECNPYVACGCGCCASEPLDARCSYPELGDDLAAVERDDKLAGQDPACGTIGCGDGIRHHCCVKPSDNDAATYEASVYSGALDRLTVTRTSEATQRCTSLVLAFPATATDRFRISAPERWAFETGSDYACADAESAAAASRRYPIGGFGEVRWAPTEGCSLDLDVTLFFLAASGGVDAVWFEASGVDAPGLLGCD